MKTADLYTWRFCPFCVNARKLLDEKGIEYQEYRIDNDEDKKRDLLEETGQDTVPYVFLDGKFIGGYDDLVELDREGKL